jgi:DNA modification methylase
MEPFKSKLKDSGSLFVVIRAGVENGRLQRYVQKTVDAMWDDGWIQPDEKVWVKPDGQPVGRKDFPRRRFEHIFWFAKPDEELYIDATAGGNESDRVGHEGFSDFYNNSVSYKSGIARVTDVIEVSPNKRKGLKHDSVYPVGLPLHLIQTYCPPGGTVLDPFSGSGTTAAAALQLKRNFIGIEINPQYVAASRECILRELSRFKARPSVPPCDTTLPTSSEAAEVRPRSVSS